jgi:DNA repair protein RecN (Recombination protein N)
MQFSPHLNVLTGETGAGKSILLGAVNHFLKKKVPENSIRDENTRLMVEALFTEGDEEFVLRREVNKKKSICYINGNMVPFFQLKEKAERLLNIYGQNEHVFLLNSSNHLGFLDEFCRISDLLDRLGKCFRELKTLIAQLDTLKEKGEKATESLDFISFQINEIDGLKMEEGDDEALEQRLKVLSSAEEILSRAHQLSDEFYQSDNSLYNVIAENTKNIEFLKGIYPELQNAGEEIERFYNLLPDFSNTLSHIIGSVDYSEDELNDVENKLLQLNRLKTKYKMNLSQLLKKRDDLVKERNLLADMDFSISEKMKEINKSVASYQALNRQIRERRTKKGRELSKLIESELKKLEMSKAHFLVKIDEVEPDMNTLSEKGTDKIEFYFSSNPGQEPGRIKDIASGGELSRLMLVLKSIIRDNAESTFIFDEVDTGIGGKTAEFVGEKLRSISRNHQVICISHLPQIASFADSHFLVSKEFKKNRTFSSVRELSEEERASEIGRLMVGSNVNGDVLKAAQTLMEKNRV